MTRPTLQDIADKLGLSKMTVSRALRGERHVRQEVMEAVRAEAEALDYRPDPEISKLMSYMRRSRRSESPRTLAFIWAEKSPGTMRQSSWSMDLFSGARQRATQLGFELSEFHLAERGMTAPRLSSILEARGIPGFILSPLLSRSRGHVAMRWEKFSSAVIGLGFARPPQHRVHHHHFLGMMETLHQLKRRGYRRIGFFSGSTIDERMFRAWSASFLVHHPLPRKEAAGLLCLVREPTRQVFSDWMAKARPQVVIDSGRLLWPWLKGIRVPEELGYATLSWESDQPERAGIDQQAGVLGAAAVDLVVEQFHRNERGTPEHAKVLMTTGRWRDGGSLRSLRP